MSSRPEDAPSGQRAQAPRRGWPNLTLLASLVGVVAIAIVIGYALLHANRVVPGAAVATDNTQLPPPLAVGTKAPAFEVRGGVGSFSSSQLAGTPYLLEIFATWCPHCQRMTRVLSAIRAQMPTSKLAMLSVTGSPYGANSTPDNIVLESQADVNAFESTYGVTWSTSYDPDLVVARKFGLDGFPTIFIVDRRGTIVYAASGEIAQDVLIGAIRRAQR